MTEKDRWRAIQIRLRNKHLDELADAGEEQRRGTREMAGWIIEEYLAARRERLQAEQAEEARE
jgi:hypothetical protein